METERKLPDRTAGQGKTEERSVAGNGAAMEAESWERGVRRVVPYTPGEQPRQAGIIKLNTNECPYPPSPQVKRLAAEFETELLRLYPDPEASLLVKSIAKRFCVEEDQVFVGVGSDDVLAMAFLTFFNTGQPILFPDVTYSFYDVWAQLFGIPWRRPALDESFRLVKEDYLVPNGGIVIANPNAPTGICEPLSVIEEIVAKNPASLVIIDEAYVDFGGESCVPLIHQYDNLLVVQTFSKSRQLAGARLGLAMGNAALIADLNRVKFSLNPYNINRLTLKAGEAALKDTAYFDATRQKIMDTRAWTAKELANRGFSLTDSRSNFLFARTDRMEGGALYRALKEKGILVRHFDSPRIADYLRITIGTQAQMEALIKALDEILEG